MDLTHKYELKYKKKKCTKGSNKLRIKLDSNQIKKPKLSKTTLHGIDDNFRRNMTRQNTIGFKN